MVQRIDRTMVQQLMDQGARVVEVLDESEYQRIHIRGAECIPLEELGERATHDLDPDRPVVVYCYDYQ